MPLPQLVRDVLDFCYPGICAHCSASCPGSTFLCDDCDQKLNALAIAPSCGRCAMPLAQQGAPCPYCKGRGLAPFDRIVRLGVFDEPLKNLIHMKYHRRWNISERLADRLAADDRVRQLITQGSVLVPIPLHCFRHMLRGYNHAEVMARRLAGHFNCTLASPVKRIKDTEMQAQIHAVADRHANVKDAFKLTRPRAVEGKHVVVIDDVMTTGSTLKSFARTLKPAQPASVSAIVVAIADPRGRGFQTI